MSKSAAINAPIIETGAGQYILIREEQPNGTQAGTFTSGAWRTRVLNTLVNDDTGAVTLSSNQFTLPAGTYRVYSSAPAFWVQGHKIRLRNITDGTTELKGTAGFTQLTLSATANQNAIISGQFILSSTKTFELQHYSTQTRASNGFGVGTAGDGEIEIFAFVQLLKVA